MGVTPAGKMGSWSCAMVLPASLAPAFPPRNCPFLVQSIFLASHKLPPHFRMSDITLGRTTSRIPANIRDSRDHDSLLASSSDKPRGRVLHRRRAGRLRAHESAPCPVHHATKGGDRLQDRHAE